MLSIEAIPFFFAWFTDPPEGYSKERDGNFYKAYNQSKTWKEAQEICHADGSSLAVPWDSVTNEIIRGLIPGQRTIIGLTDMAEEGTWLTVHEAPLRFKHWNENEPNDGNDNQNEDCGFMNKETGRWNDDICNAEDTFVCQFETGTVKLAN